MKIDGYYRQSWAPSNIDPNILENRLGCGIESDVAPVIDRLIQAPETLTGDEAATLSAYLELQRIRVPRQAAWAMNLMRRDILEQIGPELRKKLKDNRLQLIMKDAARFDFMRSALGTLHPWFGRMEWEVVEAVQGSAFITTDSPVSFLNQKFVPPDEAGIGLAGTLVFFPLSSRKLLLMRHPEGRSVSPLDVLPTPDAESESARVPLTFGGIWDAEFVSKTNWYLAGLSHHLCVAGSDVTLEQAVFP